MTPSNCILHSSTTFITQAVNYIYNTATNGRTGIVVVCASGNALLSAQVKRLDRASISSKTATSSD